MKKKFDKLKLYIDSLTVFSSLKYDPVIASLRELLDALSLRHDNDTVRIYSDFASALYEHTCDLTEYIRTIHNKKIFTYHRVCNIIYLIHPERR